jgi:flagellar basal body-associated protein FliL
MMTFFIIVFAFLAIAALGIIALFFSCDRAAEREQEQNQNDNN